MNNAYEILRKQTVKEYDSEVMLLRHKKSGARVLTMANDDENKVFSIGFRTPPSDSTGLPHIMEHSVLCGSRKFPVKDPFIELAKGSLNTFLNAMTYPDKTVYPVASCNDKDFANLMDVYLDAVFYPNIHEEESIFRQEGWRYELESADGELTYNGVVYNEMKGVYSSPDSVIERQIMAGLFPDTTYSNESGGFPDDVPNLTYEDFKAFHKKYYHPSNSYIYLYGDMDMEEKLAWMDEEYLSAFDAIEVDSEIGTQEPFEALREMTVYVPISEEQDEEEESCLSLGMVVGDGCDVNLRLALSILEFALIKTPGAPLRQALLDAGIAADVYGGFETDIKQTYLSLTAKGAPVEKKDEFLKVVRETLEKLVEKGIDEDSLKAGMNSIEFLTREGDTGRFPKGLMIGLETMGLWLYDADAAIENLEYEKLFVVVKEMMASGGFEKLIKDLLLDNPHSVLVCSVPKKGLQKENEEKLAAKLAGIKAGWSEDELNAVMELGKRIKAWQDSEDSEEDINKIPVLERSDLKREITPYGGEFIPGSEETAGIPVFHSDIFTSGIVYMKFMFDCGDLTVDELPYFGLLSRVIGMFDTEHYSYRDLSNKVGMETGGLGIKMSYMNKRAAGEFSSVLSASVKVFADKIAFPFEILEEIICRTDYSSDKRFKEVLDEIRYGLQDEFMSAGHLSSVLRAQSHHSRQAYSRELTGGMAFFRFIEDACANFDERKETIREQFAALIKKVVVPERLLLGLTCVKEDAERVISHLKAFAAALPSGAEQEAVKFGCRRSEYELSRVNEAFTTPGSVSFVACTGNFADAGMPYRSELAVLRTIMSYDYLWNRIRVRGGAYGAMCGFGRDGETSFVSYRDPNVADTMTVYEELPAYVESFDVNERDMTKFLIGTMSGVDAPLSPHGKGKRNLSAFLSELDPEEEQKYRDDILNVSPEKIRELAPYMKAILENRDICVIGNETKIDEAKDMFDEVGSLFSAKE